MHFHPFFLPLRCPRKDRPRGWCCKADAIGDGYGESWPAVMRYTACERLAVLFFNILKKMQNQTQTSPNFEVSKPKQAKPSGNFRPFCVSLDWLSVSCIDQGYIFYDREEQPSGYKLVAQNHGSTIYRSLFDIYDPSGVLVGELHAHPYNKSIDQRSVIVKADNALLYPPPACAPDQTGSRKKVQRRKQDRRWYGPSHS